MINIENKSTDIKRRHVWVYYIYICLYMFIYIYIIYLTQSEVRCSGGATMLPLRSNWLICRNAMMFTPSMSLLATYDHPTQTQWVNHVLIIRMKSNWGGTLRQMMLERNFFVLPWRLYYRGHVTPSCSPRLAGAGAVLVRCGRCPRASAGWDTCTQAAKETPH